MNQSNTPHNHKQRDRQQMPQQFQRQRQQMRQQQQTHHNQKNTNVRKQDLLQQRTNHPDLSRLPRVNFINETYGDQHVHNAQVITAIPEGQRCLLWFNSTSSALSSGTENTESMNRCVLIELTDANRMGKRYPIKTCFHTSLAYGNGTVVLGTLSHIAKLKTVAIHDIYYYKGTPYNNTKYIDRLTLIGCMFQHEIQQISYFTDQFVIGLPLMIPGNMTRSDLLNHLQSTPYPVAKAQYHYNDRKDNSFVNVSMSNIVTPPIGKNINHQHGNKYHNNHNNYQSIRNGKMRIQDAVFLVSPDIQNDIYRIETIDGFYGFAAIQSYDTSKFMNKLFRKIKENGNLDLLEESDDEDDFENVAEDKYVYIDKTYRLLCRYLPKINKWEPYKTASRGSHLTNANEIHDVGRVLKDKP